MLRRALLPLAALALILTSAPPAAAAPAPGGDAAWSVQPSSRSGPGNRPFLTYDLAPGGTVTDYVGVTNLGAGPLTFAVYGSDAFTTAAGGFDLLPAARPSVGAGSWIRLAQTTVTVPARSRADIPFTLTVPDNATPGDHAAGIVASVTSASADSAGHSTTLEQRVGTRLYLRVNGPLQPGLRIDGLRATYHPGPIPFTGDLVLHYTVRNTGNTRTAPSQSARVEGLFGLPVGSAELPPVPELLPGAVLERTATVSGRPALIRLSTAVSLSTTDGANARSTVTVWALTWWYVAVLALIGGLVWWLPRRRARSRFRAAKQTA